MSSKKKWVIALGVISGFLAVTGVVTLYIKKTFDAIGDINLDFTDDEADLLM